jgi:hypothetical protein
VALDQNVTPADPEVLSAPAIENELPAYRAISATAVVGLIAGVLAVASFASPFFLSFAVLAIVLGVYADRKIRHYPDALTGLGLARAAITLGLVFGLASITTTTVQSLIRTMNAARFGKQMVSVLATGSVADAIWYTAPIDYREGKSAIEVYKEILNQSKGPAGLNSRFAGIEAIKKRLTSASGQEIHFVKVEETGSEGLDIVAAARVEIHGPATKEFPDPEQFALLVMRGRTYKGRLRWMLESIAFPYQPNSYVPQAKPVDDGHGHAH